MAPRKKTTAATERQDPRGADKRRPVPSDGSRSKKKHGRNQFLNDLDKADRALFNASESRPLTRVRLQDATLTLAAMGACYHNPGPRRETVDAASENDLLTATLLLERAARRQAKAATTAADEQLFDAIHELYEWRTGAEPSFRARWPVPATRPTIVAFARKLERIQTDPTKPESKDAGEAVEQLADEEQTKEREAEERERRLTETLAEELAGLIEARHLLVEPSQLKPGAVEAAAHAWALSPEAIKAHGGVKRAAAHATAVLTDRILFPNLDKPKVLGAVFLRAPAHHRRFKDVDTRPPEGDLGEFFGAHWSGGSELLTFALEALGGRETAVALLGVEAVNNLGRAARGMAGDTMRLPLQRHGEAPAGYDLVPPELVEQGYKAVSAADGSIAGAAWLAQIRRTNQGSGHATLLAKAIESALANPGQTLRELMLLWNYLHPADRPKELRERIERWPGHERTAKWSEPIRDSATRFAGLAARFDHDRAPTGQWREIPPPRGAVDDDASGVAICSHSAPLPRVAFVRDDAAQSWDDRTVGFESGSPSLAPPREEGSGERVSLEPGAADANQCDEK